MGINEKAGEVFSVAAENSPVAGCTVSKAVAEVAGGNASDDSSWRHVLSYNRARADIATSFIIFILLLIVSTF